MTARSISIIMPAFNAAGHIRGVFGRIPVGLWSRVRTLWVVNDGSTDATGALVNELALKNNLIRPVHFDRNRGYGAALKTGLALCREDGCSVAACLHADGQYPPEVIGGAADSMARQSIDILQGSRIASKTALSGGMPLYKFLANRILTFMENRAFGLRLTDYHSGMLLYSRNALERLRFDALSDSFDFDVEVIASARANGLRIAEIPIPTNYEGQHSYLRPIQYGFRIINVMRKYALGRYSPL